MLKPKSSIQALTDPAPRTYNSQMTLLRRGEFDHGALALQTPKDVEDWLLADALAETDLLALYQEFIWRLRAAGLPIARCSLHAGTLHPQLYGYTLIWTVDDGFCDEANVSISARTSDVFRRSPLYSVIMTGVRFRTLLEGRGAEQSSPLMRELAEIGITEYAALPLRTGGAYHNAATMATRQAGGFSEPQFEAIERLLRPLTLHIERHIAQRISENICTTYLGDDAGQRVLSGAITRGGGEAIEAVIWASDLRGFTQLADRLSDEQLTAVLNAYFDCLCGAVTDHGGDVLKFIGDGLLAVFPFADFATEEAAAEAAISAAEAALAALDRLNASDDGPAPGARWRPLRTGIALHRGHVFFGNVGAPQRLDFTVIGKAVNAASRVESLCKTVGRDLLITGPVAELSKRPLEDVGAFDLRGLEASIRVFATPGR